MIYRILADLTVVIHVAYVLFVILGLFLTIVGWARDWQWVRNRWFRGIHLTMILVVVLEAWVGITCPLTIWEQRLRIEAGQETYQGDFVARWLHDLLFFQASPWVFTLIYTFFGGLVVATLVWVPPRWRGQSGTPAKSDTPA